MKSSWFCWHNTDTQLVRKTCGLLFPLWSSSHQLLIQFPLKNNGFSGGRNKIFRNCKALQNNYPLNWQTPCQLDLPPCFPLESPSQIGSWASSGHGVPGGHCSPSWLLISSSSEDWSGRQEGRRRWSLCPPRLARQGPDFDGSSLSWFYLRGALAASMDGTEPRGGCLTATP